MGHIIEIDYDSNIKHISTNKKQNCFCGRTKKNQKIEKIEDYKDPDSIDNLCQSCINNYKLAKENNSFVLEPTVKCSFDIIIGDRIQRCDKVVSAYKARELKHPNSSNGSEPVCEECYKEIKSNDKNSVTTRYEEAVPWLEEQKPNKIDKKSD